MMNRKIFLRILLDLILLFAVIQNWWIIAVVLACVNCWLFSCNFEIIVIGFFYDVLFRVISASSPVSYVGTILSTGIFVASNAIAKIIRR